MRAWSRHLVFAAAMLALGLLCAFACTAVARADDGETSKEAARNALNGRTSFPFYDAQKDDVKRMDVKVDTSKPVSQGNQKWTNTGTTPAARAPRGPSTSGLGMFFQVLGLSLLTLIIGALIVFLVMAFLKGEQTQTQGAKFIDTSSDVDRVENLPFQLKKPSGDFLSEAQRLYEAGKYSEAIVYLFSYQLVALDKRHVIRLAKGKTNRQYLRETRSREPLKQLLQRTMISFEDVFFGHHDLSRERFEESWRRLDEFHQQLERVEAAAA
jgi:hypothetical protein